MAWTDVSPRPPRPNTVSTTTTPPRNRPLSTPSGETTGVRSADPGRERPPPLGQALGPGGPDVVLTEGIQQLAAGQPGVDGGLHGRQADPGQDHVPRPRAE